MKTITLTDPAYERLASWKMKPKESFSAVVLKVVPQRGTLGDMVEFAKQVPALPDGFFEAVKEARVADHNPAWDKDPWTA
ncbi:MAG: antitoxin VapB family protein [Kiritimatiellae bacterium]|nr:antitoxin VapB family protein [Kiritimatiellia bacterium]